MKASILVQNLKCGGCANTISNKILSLENISNVDINIEAGKVSFNYTNEADALEVKEKLKKLGYPSIESPNTFTTKAKSFVSCASGKLN